MPIHIRVAQSARDLESAQRMWDAAFGGLRAGRLGAGASSGRSALLVTDGKRPIGVLRMTRGDRVGRAALAHPGLDALAFLVDGRRVAVVDWMVLEPRYQARFSILFAMVKVVLQVVKHWACDHLVWVAPSGLVAEMEHVGLARVGPARTDHGGIVPLYAPLTALRRSFLAELGGPLAGLTPFFHRVVFAQGDDVFREGDPADCAYVVVRGSVSVTARRAGDDGSGEEVLIEILGPGSLVGELALLDRQPRMVTVRAYAAETDLVVIEARRFQQALLEDPVQVSAVLRLMAASLRRGTRRSIALAPDDAGPALLRLILDVARSCGLKRTGMIPGLTPEWVAGQIGRLPDAVLEMSGVLERRGLITWSIEGLWIHDLDALENEWAGRRPVRRPFTFESAVPSSAVSRKDAGSD